MFASHESGWCTFSYPIQNPIGMSLMKEKTAPNDNIYSTATSLSGPWSSWQDFATSGTNTFSSQIADVISVNGVVMFVFHFNILLDSQFPQGSAECPRLRSIPFQS
jgi:hypothetical protein